MTISMKQVSGNQKNYRFTREYSSHILFIAFPICIYKNRSQNIFSLRRNKITLSYFYCFCQYCQSFFLLYVLKKNTWKQWNTICAELNLAKLTHCMCNYCIDNKLCCTEVLQAYLVNLVTCRWGDCHHNSLLQTEPQQRRGRGKAAEVKTQRTRPTRKSITAHPRRALVSLDWQASRSNLHHRVSRAAAGSWRG